MKIILSKKGFDTTFGGYPSILDGMSLISMPIPSDTDPYIYSDLKLPSGSSLFEAVKSYYKTIYNGKIKVPFLASTKCHADPNLTNYFGVKNFLGSIGQAGKAQGHLRKQNTKEGDLFLFYGLFKDKASGKEKHVIWGYLQIGEIIKTHGLDNNARIKYEAQYPWLKQQPHWSVKEYADRKTNTIYIACEKCSFAPELNGYGAFAYAPMLDLTEVNAATQREWLVPELAGLTISWNGGRKVQPDGAFITAPTYGQEFVIEESDKAIKWAATLIKKAEKI